MTPTSRPATRPTPPRRARPARDDPAGTAALRRAVAILALLGAVTGCALSTAASQTGRPDLPSVTARPPAGTTCPPTDAAGTARELRGLWIATVRNLDWPPRPGLSADRQRAAFRALLDAAARRHINAVFVQIRPTSDAFYPSPHEPWSQWLTGEQGRDPGYDPLKFMITEAHARGMQFHAWFNPYRVGDAADRDKLHPSHPARVHPDWVHRYGRHLWYDPGRPEVRDLAIKTVMDVVSKYDVDGVHFDDYFYPYPEPGQTFRDDATYKRYGSGFDDRGDWRRHNVNVLIRDLSGKIRAAKPWVRFGISPFGVWRNARTDPAGSRTTALQSYDDVYADTRTWMRERWVDYVAPQLYWHIGFRAADYRELARWWARLGARTKTEIYTGQAAYRVGEPQWRDPAELSRHVAIDREHASIRGQIYFSAKSLVGNARGFADHLTRHHYRTPTLPPVVPHRSGAPARPVATVSAAPADGGVQVRWRGTGAPAYAIYRLDGRADPCAAKGRHLVGVRRGTAGTGELTFTDRSARPGRDHTFVVTALNRYDHESAPGPAATVSVPKG